MSEPVYTDQEFREIEDRLNLHITPRPISEYHEDMGDVIWWKFPIVEPPWIGHPGVLGQEVVIRMPTVGQCTAHVDRDLSPSAMKPKKIIYPGGTFFVGGWPGYHTHWTPIPKVKAPLPDSIDPDGVRSEDGT